MMVYSGLLEAASGGIFLYVSTMHLLVEELESKKHRLLKIIIFTASIALSFLSTRVLELVEMNAQENGAELSQGVPQEA
tara:strand:- start:1030 stop:1266 length:237 start_codon:yes stop_codon:yes gene_type:complete